MRSLGAYRMRVLQPVTLYYVGAICFAAGVSFTFILPERTKLVQDHAQKQSVKILQSIGDEELNKVLSDDDELWFFCRNQTSPVFENYKSILCEPFLPEWKVKLLAMFGPILLALGGLLISIAFCYPTDSDDQVYNYVAIRQLTAKQEKIVERSRHNIMVQTYHSDAQSFPDLDPNLPSTSQSDRLLKSADQVI